MQPVLVREPPVHAEIDNADGVEIIEVHMDDIEVEVVQMDQVLRNDGNLEVIRIQMNDENVEIIEVQMDDVEEVPAGQAEVVAPDHYEVVELEIKTVPVPRDTGTLHLEPSEQDMVAAAKTDDQRRVGSDVCRQPNGSAPIPSATVTSAPERPTVFPRYKNGRRDRARDIRGCGNRAGTHRR